jgi:hypothetical protein
MFSNVAHFTLDLSNNKLETLPADVLYDNASNWEHEGTQILKGSYGTVKTLKISTNFFSFLSQSPFLLIIMLHCYPKLYLEYRAKNDAHPG